MYLLVSGMVGTVLPILLDNNREKPGRQYVPTWLFSVVNFVF